MTLHRGSRSCEHFSRIESVRKMLARAANTGQVIGTMRRAAHLSGQAFSGRIRSPPPTQISPPPMLAFCMTPHAKRVHLGLVFKAHGRVYHSPLGSRVKKQKQKSSRVGPFQKPIQAEHQALNVARSNLRNCVILRFRFFSQGIMVVDVEKGRTRAPLWCCRGTSFMRNSVPLAPSSRTLYIGSYGGP